MNAPIRLFAIAALAGLAACSSLTTDNPIGGSVPGQPDPRLIGVWKVTQNESKGQAGYMFVSPAKDGSTLHVVFVGWSATQPSDKMEFDAVTANLGGEAFVNVNHVIENGKAATKQELDGYMPFAYKFDKDGTLVILDRSDAGVKLIQNAIAKHQLAGKATTSNTGGSGKSKGITTTNIHLSANQKSLDAFFAANGKAIFTDSVDTFQPIKEP